VTADIRDQLQTGLAGAYTLERELGGGGMSRVFVADDAALGRKVVVKVLHAELTEGLSAERFKREIQLAARLQHPHIVPLLATGSLETGALYYTMPFVVGESLRDRLKREGELPIAEATRLLRDVASALAYAHSQHVIHRDIKPENVLISHGGAVVTDFGIAKAIRAAREGGDHPEHDGARAPSTGALTALGTTLGTPAYMAPEQAAGDAVDHRADLYALGLVAYEMLSGRSPFEGRTAQGMLAAHASETPEHIARRRPSVTPALGTLVMQLLEKHPADRPQSATEVLRSLEGSTAATAPSARRRLNDPLVVGLSVALLASVGTLAWMWSRRSSDSPRSLRARLALELPADAPLNPGTGFGNSMTFSPDGETLVYVGGTPTPRLYARRLDELTARPIAGTEGALNPEFSPDGREIGFVADFMLKAVPVTGGTPRVIAHAVGRFAWGPNNVIVLSKPSVLSPRGGLWKVSAGGGTPVEFTRTDSAARHFHGSPTFLPDGRTILFSSRPGNGNPTLELARLDDGKITDLNIVGGSPLYVRDHIVFSRNDGTVAAVRFDAKRLAVTGEPVTLLGGIVLKAGGAAEIAVSSTGVLAYLSGTVGQQIVEVDRRGIAKPVLSEIATYRDLRVSPDGRRFAVTVGPPPYSSDIRVYDFASGTLTSLTTGGTNTNAAWTPDGRRIAWTSIGQPNASSGRASGGGVWWQPWDGSAPPELLLPGAEGARFTPSGDTIIASFDLGNATELRLVPLPIDASRPATAILPAQPEPRQARLSPDGRWLAYVSAESGTQQVYIQPFPGPGGRFQISTRGGAEPAWGTKPNELLYRSGAAIMVATLALSPSVTVLRRDTVFVTNGVLNLVATTYDVLPNGNIILVKSVTTTTPPVIVFGWVDEMRETVEAVRQK